MLVCDVMVLTATKPRFLSASVVNYALESFSVARIVVCLFLLKVIA